MLITFQTDAYESITMFGHIAERLLALMGQSGRVPGAILAPDVPNALAVLTKALDREKAHSKPKNQNHDAEPEVSLMHRALPLIALLEAAAAQHCDVLWA